MWARNQGRRRSRDIKFCLQQVLRQCYLQVECNLEVLYSLQGGNQLCDNQSTGEDAGGIIYGGSCPENEVHRTSKVQRTLTCRCGTSQGYGAPCPRPHLVPTSGMGRSGLLTFPGRLASPCQTVSAYTGLWEIPLPPWNKVHHTSKVQRTLTCRCGASQGCAAPSPRPHLFPAPGMEMPYYNFLEGWHPYARPYPLQSGMGDSTSTYTIQSRTTPV